MRSSNIHTASPNISSPVTPFDAMKQTQSYKSSGIYNIAFHGLFGNSFKEKIDAGVEAVDDYTMFLATNNLENSLFVLNQNVSKLNNPILNIYVLEDKEKIKCPFAIIKDDKKYIMMNPSTWHVSKVKNEKSYDSLSSGEICEIKSGEFISQELFDKNPIQITIPQKTDKSNAEKHLNKYSLLKTHEDISRYNSSVFSSVLTESNDRGLKKITFDDVGGLERVVQSLKERVICPLKYPQAFSNIRLNKGILLCGPPRCGKTLVGMAVANEVNANYLYINANEMTHAHVGRSEENWRNLFKTAQAKQPCILFIDEIDSAVKKRKGSDQSRFEDSVVNQILGLMSDLEKSNSNVFVIAATNRKDLIDKAMLDSGRFGMHIEVPLPDKKAISQIYEINAKKQNIAENVEKEKLFEKMFESHFNGSDVPEVITNAYHNALQRGDMYTKMLNDSIKLEEIQGITITNEDLFEAFEELKKQKQSTPN